MNGRNRKKRFSTVGRRTGYDVRAGKRIRESKDGMERFDDYWTSSGDDTDASNPSPLCSSPVLSNAPRMSSFIKNINPSPRRELPARISRARTPTLKKGSNENEVQESVVPKQITEKKQLLAKGRRTGADILAGKEIQIINGIENFDNYWTDSSALTTIRASKTSNNRSSLPNYTSRGKISNISRESVRNKTTSPCVSKTPHLSGTSTHEENEINQGKNNTIIINSNNRSSLPNYTSRGKISNISHKSVRNKTASTCVPSTSHRSSTSSHEENEINQGKNNTIIITPNNRSSIPNYTSRSKMSNSHESVRNKTASPSVPSTSRRSSASSHEENEINLDKNNTIIITPNNRSSIPNYTSRSKMSNSHKSVRNKTASPSVPSTSHLSSTSIHEENEINQDKNNTIIITPNKRSSVPNYTSHSKISNISHESIQNKTVSPRVPSTSRRSSASTHEEIEINQDINETNQNEIDVSSKRKKRRKKSTGQQQNVEVESGGTQLRRSRIGANIFAGKEIQNINAIENFDNNWTDDNALTPIRASKTSNNRSTIPNYTSHGKISNISHESIQNKTASPCVPSTSHRSSASTHEENEISQDINETNHNEINVSSRSKKRKKNSTEHQQNVEIKSGVTQLRRSQRKRFPPLERWRSQRLHITYENFNIVSVDVEEGNEPITDDVKAIIRNRERYEERKKKIKSRKPKVLENSLNLKQVRNELNKAEVFDPRTSDEKYVYLHRPHNTLLWSVPPLKEKKTAAYTIAKCFSSDLISFGFIEIRCGKEKSKQHSPEHNIAFNVIKGNNLKMTIHQSNFTLKELDFIAVPAGNIYSIFNKGKSDALLSFSTFKTPMFDYQFPHTMEGND